MQCIDIDGNGKLSLDEFNSFWLSGGQGMGFELGRLEQQNLSAALFKQLNQWNGRKLQKQISTVIEGAIGSLNPGDVNTSKFRENEFEFNINEPKEYGFSASFKVTQGEGAAQHRANMEEECFPCLPPS